MASASKIARAVRGRGAAAPEAVTPAKPADAPRDLDDPKVQEAILVPTTLDAIAGGQTITLHPLPAQQSRQFAGLCAQVFAEVAGRPGSMQLRIAGALAESAVYARKFFGYVVRSTYPPDFRFTSEANAQADAEVDRLERDVPFREIGPLFDALTLLNRIAESFAGPK